MKKRFLSIVLALSMLIAFMPIIASAATSGTCGNNLTWTLDNNGTLTISGTGAMTNYDYGESPFSSNGDIRTIIIEKGVTSISKSAFENCFALESVAIPDSITSIGQWAFLSCRSLTSINVDANNKNYCSVDGNLFNKNKTTLIQYALGKTEKTYTIPDGVTTLNTDSFAG